MRHMVLLTDPTDLRNTLSEFNEELDAIVKMHRYLVTTAMKDFTNAYERLLKDGDPETYDGGDAIWDAERELGINAWDVASHAGLMAISRGISLAEATLARMAAAHVREPERWVFPNGNLWPRSWESKFYGTALEARFNVKANGFGAVRELRDLYAHGYGVPATEDRRTRLARKLYSQFNVSSITSYEEALGYAGDAYFFGEGTEYSPTTQLLKPMFFGSMRADVSPLATFRVLTAIGEHIMAAHRAFAIGFIPNDEIEESDYVQTVTDWWKKILPTPT